MCKSSIVTLLVFMLLALVGVSRATGQTYYFDSNLDPFQEVPPHNTPGYGSADLTLNATTGVISITPNTGVYADLLAGAITVRLQDAAVGANGPTLGTFTLDTPGNTSGTFSGNASAALTAAQITDVRNGNTYLNITDAVYPSGEIRGQIFAVPEPASLTVLSGVLLIGLRKHKRRSCTDGPS